MGYVETFRKEAKRHMAEDPAMLRMVADFALFAQSEAVMKYQWLPIFGQKFRASFDLADVYFLLKCHWALYYGEMVMVKIAMPSGAPSNRDLMKMESVHLPHPFRVGFSEEHIGDGFLAWTEPVAMQQHVDDDLRDVIVESAVVPVEVGTTQPQTTWYHLMQSQGIARWPYDDDCLYILRVLPDAYKQWLGARP